MKIKFPSISTLWTSFLKVILRFPLQVLVAIAATIAWCLVVDTSKRTEEELILFLCICNLALTVLLAVDLYAESNKLSFAKQWAFRLIGLFICIGLHFILKPAFYLADVYRIALLAFAFHLLVAYAPFINKGSANGFWQYNKTLFLRILTSALYAGVLFAGLAIALVAIDGLFNVNIKWEVYMRLFAVVTAGFMTIFFLAGIPSDFEELDKDESYPKGLKIFTQYVLIPLMTIYLLILLVYEAKIIINWELPKGLVSTLILGYAVFGILSLLLIQPVKDKEGNGWIKLFSRFFYVMMIPLVVLLLLAVWKRVDSYGITESRYILVILAIWLTLITVYFLFSKKQNIKIIPVSLSILAVLSTYGPQGAFSVSRFSQVKRLNKLMKSNDEEDVKQRSAVIDYLVDRHGLTTLQPFTKVNLRELEHEMELKDTAQYRYAIKRDKIDTAYSLLKVKRAEYAASFDYKQFEPETGTLIDIKGYDYLIPIESYNDKFSQKIGNVELHVERDKQSKSTKVIVGETVVGFDILKMSIGATDLLKAGKLKGSGGKFYLPAELLSIVHKVGNMEVKLVVTTLNTTINADKKEELDRWFNYNGYLLVRIK
jgi:hypothetical protein